MRRRILTLPIPLAGLIAGNLSKNAAYAAAHKGEIEVVRFGRILRAPVVPLEEKLGLEPGAIEQMILADPALAAMAGIVVDSDSGGPKGPARRKQLVAQPDHRTGDQFSELARARRRGKGEQRTRSGPHQSRAASGAVGSEAGLSVASIDIDS